MILVVRFAKMAYMKSRLFVPYVVVAQSCQTRPASIKGTLFMFASHGGLPHSMTKRRCKRLAKEARDS